MEINECKGSAFSKWKVNGAHIRKIGFSISSVLPSSFVREELDSTLNFGNLRTTTFVPYSTRLQMSVALF
jgi:hypothetical protein